MTLSREPFEQADVRRRVAPEEDSDSYWVTSRYGILIDTRQQVWSLDGKHSVNVGALREIIGRQLLPGFDAALRYCARTLAPSTLEGLAGALHHYRRALFPGETISRWAIADLLNYRTCLMDEFGHAFYLYRLRSYLRRWYSLGHAGVDKAVHNALEEMRFEQLESGRAVRRMDPKKGPLTQQEQADLDSDVFRGAESGAVRLDELAQYLLQNARTGSGRRPDQLAKLKCRDVDPGRRAKASDSVEPSASGYHLIRVPRSKRHGAGWRQTFRDIVVSSSMFDIVYAQRLSVEFQFEEIVARGGLAVPVQVLPEIKPDLPLFPVWESVEASIEQASNLKDTQHRWTLLRQHAAGREWHAGRGTLNARLQALVARLDAKSRTGEPLSISSQRMRYSKGTNLARSGASVETIAWLLDHATTTTASVYVDNLPEDAAAINERLKDSSQMQLLVRMFRGELVDSEAQARRGNIPRISRILWRGEGAATCGADKRCGMGEGIPLACYTCNNFQPWVDGPHEAVLEYLRSERASEAQFLGEDNPIVKRRDETMQAVEDVIQRCQRRRGELANNRSGNAEPA